MISPPPPTPKQAADLAAFYSGQQPQNVENTPDPQIRGGLYSPEEMARTEQIMNAPIEPGSWRDFEMRGIPVDNWPEPVRLAFIADQAKPQQQKQRLVRSDGWYSDNDGMTWHHPAPHAAPSPVPTGQYHGSVTITAADVPTIISPPDYAAVINELTREIHQGNVTAGWWTDIKTGQTLLGKDEHGRDRRNVGELLCLVHSEISEAMEGYRKNLMDDKLPHRTMLEVELADALIRIFDIAGAHDLDLGGAIREKRQFNATREDHKIANRVLDHGKKF